MIFNSIDFLLFFPIVVAVFFVVPKKIRYVWLLICSYYFYMSWNPKYAFLLALSTVITYLSGLVLEKCNKEGKKKYAKCCVALSLVSNLGILGIFKYANFILSNLEIMMSRLGVCGGGD